MAVYRLARASTTLSSVSYLKPILDSPGTLHISENLPLCFFRNATLSAMILSHTSSSFPASLHVSFQRSSYNLGASLMSQNLSVPSSATPQIFWASSGLLESTSTSAKTSGWLHCGLAHSLLVVFRMSSVYGMHLCAICFIAEFTYHSLPSPSVTSSPGFGHSATQMLCLVHLRKSSLRLGKNTYFLSSTPSPTPHILPLWSFPCRAALKSPFRKK
mmetsp:Transcript_24308/g.73011  ORF Transcript_24308/g.73011 Transcript_24308/m.73011 type:complete len:216 (-) Transcript_24308:174-821(-)